MATPITEQRWRADVPDFRNDDNVSPHPSDVEINEAEGWQTTVATVRAEGLLTWQEVEARANVIAAAPDLLAALKAVSAASDHNGVDGECDCDGDCEEASAAWSRADRLVRAAIARAEGRTDGH